MGKTLKTQDIVNNEDVPVFTRNKSLSQMDALNKKAIEGLGKKVLGFESSEVKTTYEVDPMGERFVKNEVVTRKQNPPDLAAIIFTLTNIDGDNWRAKPSPDNSAGAVDDLCVPDLSGLSEDQLRGLLEHFSKS